MEAQVNDTESDLSDVDDVSILQTEDGNTCDIGINYSNDVSNVGTIIYDQNLRNDGESGVNYLKSGQGELVKCDWIYLYI